MNDGSVRKFPASWRYFSRDNPQEVELIFQKMLLPYIIHIGMYRERKYGLIHLANVLITCPTLDVLRGHPTITARGHGAYDYGPIDSYVINRYGASFSYGGSNSSLPFSMPWFTDIFIRFLLKSGING